MQTHRNRDTDTDTDTDTHSHNAEVDVCAVAASWAQGSAPRPDAAARFRGTRAGANERDDRGSKYVAAAIRDGEFERMAKEMSD
jgi:hypothetical protein